MKKSEPNITSEVMDITPAIAKQMLEKNTNNPRNGPISRAVVKSYADDILHDRWQLNGEAIVFDEDGRLVNGQHRLCGVIMAKKAVKMLVVKGVSRDVSVFDIQYRRTPSQLAAAEGIDADASVMATAGIIVNRFQRVRKNMAVNEYVRQNIDELSRAKRVCCYGTNKYSKNSACIAATYLMLRTKTMPVYEVELFWRLFNDYGYTSADGYEASPAMIARNMFDDREGQNGYQIQKEKIEIAIMAMNDFHKNKKREMKYRIGEPFQFMELLNKVRKEDGLED